MRRGLSPEQTTQILTGAREIPQEVTTRVEQMLADGTPIADVDQFSGFIIDINYRPPSKTEQDQIQANYHNIIALGACSLEMAWQQAGDIAIPRPRRLGEHNQSVLNTFDRVFAAEFNDPRDRLLKPMFALQDGGKAHCVALADPNSPLRNRNQGLHNQRMAQNLLDPLAPDILTADEKTVIKLLISQSAIGPALKRHSQKNHPLGQVIAEAQSSLDELRSQCPPDFKDRFDDYLLVSYLADAGAHTQQARYKDVATGQIRPDVLPEDRFNPDGSDADRSLDQLFSEAPEDIGKLKLFQPEHMAVMQQLFPNHY